MSKAITDETVSSRPIIEPDASDVASLDARVDKINTAIENLERLAEALGHDQNWKIISSEFQKRLVNIAVGFFTRNNPSNASIVIKYAVAWGEFHQILQLTEREIGVKSEINMLKIKKESVKDKIAKIIKSFVKNEKG